jgi:hypothetical protein
MTDGTKPEASEFYTVKVGAPGAVFKITPESTYFP